MIVIVERTGGFAGIKRRAERDGGTLTQDQLDSLKTVMEAPPSPPAPGADRFLYRVTVNDAEGSRHVTVPESAMPGSLARIVTE